QTGVAFFCIAFSGSFAGNTYPQASNKGFDAASFGFFQASANQPDCGTYYLHALQPVSSP
ncbi:MAG: hypothetical protein KAT50_09840, partial [Pirellulales bacterium]|nr:hypothetical protein [Pirellulales bacterium]